MKIAVFVLAICLFLGSCTTCKEKCCTEKGAQDSTKVAVDTVVVDSVSKDSAK
jgi:hypothetical protein